MSRQKSSSNLAVILARFRRAEGRTEGFVFLKLLTSVILALIAVAAKYLIG